MAYKNPIPVLEEDRKYKTFSIRFNFVEALTIKEAAKALNNHIENMGYIPETWIKGENEEIEYQK